MKPIIKWRNIFQTPEFRMNPRERIIPFTKFKNYRVFHPTMSISVQLWIGTGCSTSAGRGAWMETDG
jgi:hypothetical protein